MRRTPLLPAATPDHRAGTPTPSAEMAPTPVTATRLTTELSGCARPSGALGDELADAVDDFSDGLHRQCGLIGNENLERILDREHEIGGVERVESELLERTRRRDRRRIELFLLRDGFDDLAFDIVWHGIPGCARMIPAIVS